MNRILCALLVAGFALPSLAADAPAKLTLRQAEDLALAQHPRISEADLQALATQQVEKETRAAFFPNIYASGTGTGVGDPNNTRITAGMINNPSIYQRLAAGATVEQLITDFGRTSSLTKSSKLQTKASEMNKEATREEVLLEVNSAFFSALRADAVLKSAQETERTRSLTLDQIQTLATNQMRSALDVSFASVDVDQAKLLVAGADRDLHSALANLALVLGQRDSRSYELVDEPMPGPLTNSEDELVIDALENRPDLQRARYQRDAAKEFAQAQKKLAYPTLSALADAGVTPLGDSRLNEDYLAAGINLHIPIFTGGLYKARQREAEFDAAAADQRVREQEDIIVRDTRVAKLGLDYAFSRLSLTASLLENANKALQLAQARFRQGSSSIVELSQAELNQTEAVIEDAGARYDYHIQRAALDFQTGRLH